MYNECSNCRVRAGQEADLDSEAVAHFGYMVFVLLGHIQKLLKKLNGNLTILYGYERPHRIEVSKLDSY